ncbi:MAG TPA: hypothetical protein VNC16_04060 [Solirubrobacterales bacterium]|jgi:hypothetical protein|nr:hypothetical protein [Solirubrobacterales bacterium]
MSRRIKGAGILILAMLAFAVPASSASAVVAEFAAASYSSTLTGTQTSEHVFSTKGGQFKCKSASFSAVLIAESPTLPLATPGYANCTRGVEAVTVTINGCTYTLQAGLSTGAGKSSGGMKIVCGEGKDIVLKAAGGCEAKVHATPEWVGFNSYENNGTSDFDVTFASEFAYMLNNKCGVAEGNYAGGTLTGKSTVKGSTGSVQITP